MAIGPLLNIKRSMTILTAKNTMPNKIPSFRKLVSTFLKYKIVDTTVAIATTTGMMDSKNGRSEVHRGKIRKATINGITQTKKP